MEKFYILTMIVLLIAVAIVAKSIKKLFMHVTVYESEEVLLFRDGKFMKTLPPGSYWLWAPNTSVERIEMRPNHMIVSSQELMTADGMPLKMSIIVESKVVDSYAAHHNVTNYQMALYTVSQLVLREVIAPLNINEITTSRMPISEAIVKLLAPKAREFGIEIIAAGVRDIMIPGEVKKIMSQVVKAQMESRASLERARGETAALRSLANAARLVEANPALLQLRLMQSLGENSGNTVVYGIPPELALKNGEKPKK